jgi:hypothetical protein
VVSVQQSSNEKSEEGSSEEDGESELTDHDAIRANLNATGTITISVESETEGRTDATRTEKFVPNIHRKNLDVSLTSDITNRY